ncbi:cysteine hydrolase [Streptomyces sp. NPDC097619]|uniref:cysteine hydrolase family protein n=1 Tax=Streptomyces sp. NPDC097619 TaxID=3157228 RepID=UPI003331AFC0
MPGTATDGTAETAGTVLLTVECQNGVVGERSALPELAASVRDSGTLERIAALAVAARAAGIQVVHAVAERRPDGRGANTNARLFRAAGRLPVRQLTGSEAVELAAPLTAAPEDLVVRRLHGLSPMAGTDLDPLLRNLGCRTLVVTGVSSNIAVPNTVFDAVNHGYAVVVPTDAVAGVPAAYTAEVLKHSLSLVAALTDTAALLDRWTGAGR